MEEQQVKQWAYCFKTKENISIIEAEANLPYAYKKGVAYIQHTYIALVCCYFLVV